MIYVEKTTEVQDIWLPRESGNGGCTGDAYLTESEAQQLIDESIETAIEEKDLITRDDLGDYYTSAQTESAISQAISEIPPVDLSDYYTSAQTESAIQEAISGIDLSNYTTTADTALLEEVVAASLNDLEERKLESGDLAPYYTSAETQEYVQEAISGVDLTNYYTSAQTDTKIHEATSAITANLSELENIVEVDEEVTARGLLDLNERVSELSASTENYITSGNLKTINNQSLIGQGNIEISASTTQADWNTTATTDPSYIKNKPTIPTQVSQLQNDAGYITDSALTDYYTSAQTESAITEAISGIDLSNYYTSAQTDSAITQAIAQIPPTDLSDYYTSAQTQSAISQSVSGKQDTLVSGTNIKTINNESLLGSGNITIQGGGGAGVVELTQAEYDALVDPDPDTIYVITDAPTVDLSNFATSADVATLSADTATKATKANVTARNGYYFPSWNAEGIITGTYSQVYNNTTSINGTGRGLINTSNGSWTIFAPTSAGTAGQILKSNGSGAPTWTSPNDVGIPTSSGITSIVACTQQEYDNMASHPATTLFVITD